MRALLNAIAWIFLAIAFVAMGADAYWSWKADSWSFQPIGFYLDLAAADWLADIRDWAASRSEASIRFLKMFLSLPVWAPAFLIGIPLGLATRERL